MVDWRFPCIFPWHEEANAFFHAKQRNIDQFMRWLNGRMANKMTNGSFPMHFPMTWKGKCELMCQYNEGALNCLKKPKFVILINFLWQKMFSIIQ
jgi:hypothetical protein